MQTYFDTLGFRNNNDMSENAEMVIPKKLHISRKRLKIFLKRLDLRNMFVYIPLPQDTK